MAKNTVIKNDNFTLMYDNSKKIVHHQIHKYIYGQQLREMLSKGTEILETNHATKWLSDDRNNSSLSPEDTEWAQKNWFPQTVKAGWKHWALVQPKSVIGQINIERFTKEYAKQGINVKMFSDPDEAERWLSIQ